MRKKNLLLFTSLFLLSTQIQAQEVFSVGELDPYFGEYIKPMAIGLATGMGSGWAHEARPHKVLGFDISFGATLVNFPTNALNFSTDALSSMTANNYSFVDAGGASISNLPTIVADQSANADLQKTISYTYMGTTVDQDIVIPAFDGLNIPYAPSVSLQLAIGLPKGTEIIGRYVPESGETINEYSGMDELDINTLNLWGIGVKHDIKQWIPVVKKVPFLEISGLFSYSEFNFAMTSSSIAITPDEIANASGFTIQDNSGATYNDQGFAMGMKSMTGSLLVGASIPVIRPFIGVGFNKATVETGLTGTFPKLALNSAPSSQNDIFVVNEVEEDPLYLEAEKTFMNFQAGINVKIAILTIHAQYTYQEYSMYSAGIAVGFR